MSFPALQKYLASLHDTPQAATSVCCCRQSQAASLDTSASRIGVKSTDLSAAPTLQASAAA